MSLENELGFRKPFGFVSHEALLSVYYTTTCIKKRAGEFFRPFGLTDVQFNLMMLLAHQSGAEEGLSQAQISEMMLVNRANITSLVDRMEKASLVVRTNDSADRRTRIIKLTSHGRELLDRVEQGYFQKISQIMSALSEDEQRVLVELLEKIRTQIA